MNSSSNTTGSVANPSANALNRASSWSLIVGSASVSPTNASSTPVSSLSRQSSYSDVQVPDTPLSAQTRSSIELSPALSSLSMPSSSRASSIGSNFELVPASPTAAATRSSSSVAASMATPTVTSWASAVKRTLPQRAISEKPTSASSSGVMQLDYFRNSLFNSEFLEDEEKLGAIMAHQDDWQHIENEELGSDDLAIPNESIYDEAGESVPNNEEYYDDDEEEPEGPAVYDFRFAALDAREEGVWSTQKSRGSSSKRNTVYSNQNQKKMHVLQKKEFQRLKDDAKSKVRASAASASASAAVPSSSTSSSASSSNLPRSFNSATSAPQPTLPANAIRNRNFGEHSAPLNISDVSALMEQGAANISKGKQQLSNDTQQKKFKRAPLAKPYVPAHRDVFRRWNLYRNQMALPFEIDANKAVQFQQAFLHLFQNQITTALNNPALGVRIKGDLRLVDLKPFSQSSWYAHYSPHSRFMIALLRRINMRVPNAGNAATTEIDARFFVHQPCAKFAHLLKESKLKTNDNFTVERVPFTIPAATSSTSSSTPSLATTVAPADGSDSENLFSLNCVSSDQNRRRWLYEQQRNMMLHTASKCRMECQFPWCRDELRLYDSHNLKHMFSNSPSTGQTVSALAKEVEVAMLSRTMYSRLNVDVPLTPIPFRKTQYRTVTVSAVMDCAQSAGQPYLRYRSLYNPPTNPHFDAMGSDPTRMLPCVEVDVEFVKMTSSELRHKAAHKQVDAGSVPAARPDKRSHKGEARTPRETR